MGSLRQLLRRNLPWARALLALTLAMKLLVPAGYMPALSGSGIALTICSGMAPAAGPMAAMPGMKMAHGDAPHAPARPEAPCAFAGLATPGLVGGAMLLVAGTPDVPEAASAPATAALPLRRRAHLRPPLRGPPAAA